LVNTFIYHQHINILRAKLNEKISIRITLFVKTSVVFFNVSLPNTHRYQVTSLYPCQAFWVKTCQHKNSTFDRGFLYPCQVFDIGFCRVFHWQSEAWQGYKKPPSKACNHLWDLDWNSLVLWKSILMKVRRSIDLKLIFSRFCTILDN
jgi:hypothetical protein